MVVKAFETITLARVDDGANGIPGKPGTDGKTSYFHTAYADTVSGDGFSQSPAGKSYIGTYSDFTEADSTTASDYTWVLIKGADGATGPAGKDITSYASGAALPTTVAPANSQFWVTNSSNVATAFYKSDGTKWVKTEISASAINAATFNGLTFNGVIFNGSQFISTFKSAPVDEGDFADVTDPTGQIMLTKGTGTTKMGDGYLTVDGTIDGSSGDSLQTFHTEVGPAGYLSRLYTGGTAESNITAASQLYLGQLLLSNLNSSGKRASGYLNGEMLQQLDNRGLLLWSGAMYLNAVNVVKPSLPISQTSLGWLLVWQGYTNGKPTGNIFRTSVLWKNEVLAHPGLGTVQQIGSYITAESFSMYVYPSDTQIKGNDKNLQGSGNAVVISEVYAI